MVSLGLMGIRIQTERLVLRSFEPRDVDPWIVMFSDPEVVRFLDRASRERPRTPEAFFAQLEVRLALEAEVGYATLAVELAETQDFIGQCGLRPASLLRADGGSEIDLGYHFMSAYWGCGYATEAVRATLAHGFDVVGLNHVMAVAEPGNIASWRVLEKAGMRYEGTVSYYGTNNLCRYAAERGCWQARRGAS
jgi:ribosomal-protein-alanine N-acetyltransferase